MMPVGRWVMRTAEIGGVDVLAAGTRGAHRVDADIFGPDVDVDLFGLRQHGDRRRRGVDAPAGLGRRHALHAVHAGFEFQMRKDALAGDGGDDFLVAADLALAGRRGLESPAACGGIALVHAKQVAGEKRRLVAAGAGADFEDGVLVVGRVLGQQQDLDVLLQRFDALLDLRQIGLGQCPHLGVGTLVGEHRLQIGLFMLGGAHRPDLGHHLLELGIFRRHPDIGVRRRPGRHLRFEHVETLDDLIHTVAGQIDHVAETTTGSNGRRRRPAAAPASAAPAPVP